LLVVWVGAFRSCWMKVNHDWFASVEIQALAVIAAIGFACFMIWS
jgi:DHA2 family multidrug resistance protein